MLRMVNGDPVVACCSVRWQFCARLMIASPNEQVRPKWEYIIAPFRRSMSTETIGMSFKGKADQHIHQLV